MIALYLTNIATACVCIWLLFRARKAERELVTAREDAEASFTLWCHAAHSRDRWKAVADWYDRAETKKATYAQVIPMFALRRAPKIGLKE